MGHVYSPSYWRYHLNLRLGDQPKQPSEIPISKNDEEDVYVWDMLSTSVHMEVRDLSEVASLCCVSPKDQIQVTKRI